MAKPGRTVTVPTEGALDAMMCLLQGLALTIQKFDRLPQEERTSRRWMELFHHYAGAASDGAPAESRSQLQFLIVSLHQLLDQLGVDFDRPSVN